MKTSHRLFLAALVLLVALPFLLEKEDRPEPPASAAVPVPAGAVRSALVAQVVDGDSLRLQGGERVRLLGIDAPEESSPLHDQARRALRALVEGGPVRLQAPGRATRDSYGRTLALVFREDLFLNAEMVARGMARVYLKQDAELPPDLVRRLVEAQNSAIDSRKGLWESQSALATRPGERLLATRFRFHRAQCQSLTAGGGEPTPAAPTTREAALRAGKSPCRTCNPRRRKRAGRGSPPPEGSVPGAGGGRGRRRRSLHPEAAPDRMGLWRTP